MEYRKLGRSGMYVSEIAYGNWLTHGSQIEEISATQCVHAALDVGITTFDTADAYAETRADSALGTARAIGCLRGCDIGADRCCSLARSGTGCGGAPIAGGPLSVRAARTAVNPRLR